jgi:hypothetical protein
VPAALGALDPTRSRGIASEHSLPEGRYVGFSPDGPRWLAFLAQQEALAP